MTLSTTMVLFPLVHNHGPFPFRIVKEIRLAPSRCLSHLTSSCRRTGRNKQESRSPKWLILSVVDERVLGVHSSKCTMLLAVGGLDDQGRFSFMSPRAGKPLGNDKNMCRRGFVIKNDCLSQNRADCDFCDRSPFGVIICWGEDASVTSIHGGKLAPIGHVGKQRLVSWWWIQRDCAEGWRS